MSSVCLYFQVHVPYAFRDYSFFEIGESPFYENEQENFENVMKLARECYLPANKILLELIKKHDGKFKVSFSISGTSLDLFETHAPEVIESFQELAETGCVDFIAETFAHSLSYLCSKKEFKAQVAMQARLIKKWFGVNPKVLRSTELMYNNELGKWAENAGFKAILADGNALGFKSPNFVYTPQGCEKIKLLCSNAGLSEDISLRFSDSSWNEYPLYAEKYANWLQSVEENAQLVNIFLKYENFGIHHTSESGIFDFLKALPEKVLENKNFNFKTLTEAAKLSAGESVDIHYMTSWTGKEKNLSSWQSNDLQHDALHACYSLEEEVNTANNKALLQIWRILQGSEQIAAMSLDGYAPSSTCYLQEEKNAYDVYINYMNILADLTLRVKEVLKNKKNKPTTSKSKLSAVKRQKDRGIEMESELSSLKLLTSKKDEQAA